MATKPTSQISTLEDDLVAVETAPVAAPAFNDSEYSGKMEIITIHSGSDDAGSERVFLGHNGYGHLIHRDTPTKVPTEVAQILRDSVITTYKPGANGEVVERNMPRYAFSSVPA